MFKQGKKVQLKTMHSVFLWDPDTVQYIIECMNEYILDEGRQLVEDGDN